MGNVIRIGTRKSELAQWQAKEVQKRLLELGTVSELVLIDSEGDIDLIKPLYEIGVVGVFTRSLDIALLNNKIDIAVHSMKDVPVQLPQGIQQLAVLPRADVADVLVRNSNTETQQIIATSSLRRKAQWLNRFPDYGTSELRGNVNTRLKKVEESKWEGAIFAKAGLERIHLLPDNAEVLDWMIPAPAQGAIMIVGRTEENFISNALFPLNDPATEVCVSIERKVLHLLQGGCTAPIAVHAGIVKGDLLIKAGVYSLDGSKKVEVIKEFDCSSIDTVAAEVVKELFLNNAQEILNEIKAHLTSGE